MTITFAPNRRAACLLLALAAACLFCGGFLLLIGLLNLITFGGFFIG